MSKLGREPMTVPAPLFVPWPGSTSPGTARQVGAGLGSPRQGEARFSPLIMVRLGSASLGRSGPDKASHGRSSPGETPLLTASQNGSGRVTAWPLTASRGESGLGTARPLSTRRGSSWLGSPSRARYGRAGSDRAGRRRTRLDEAPLRVTRPVRTGPFGVWQDRVWHGGARLPFAWLGVEGRGRAGWTRQNSAPRRLGMNGRTSPGSTRLGAAWCRMAPLNSARIGTTRQDVTRHGSAKPGSAPK